MIDTYEIQEIKISYRGCNETDEDGQMDYEACDPEDYFYITYDGETTGKMGNLTWASLFMDSFKKSRVFNPRCHETSLYPRDSANLLHFAKSPIVSKRVGWQYGFQLE